MSAVASPDCVRDKARAGLVIKMNFPRSGAADAVREKIVRVSTIVSFVARAKRGAASKSRDDARIYNRPFFDEMVFHNPRLRDAAINCAGAGRSTQFAVELIAAKM